MRKSITLEYEGKKFGCREYGYIPRHPEKDVLEENERYRKHVIDNNGGMFSVNVVGGVMFFDTMSVGERLNYTNAVAEVILKMTKAARKAERLAYNTSMHHRELAERLALMSTRIEQLAINELADVMAHINSVPRAEETEQAAVP